jgi:hypothetical protein
MTPGGRSKSKSKSRNHHIIFFGSPSALRSAIDRLFEWMIGME